MRSGLQKPVAIPFIVLILFSLLSLVSTFAKEWEFKGLNLGYIMYHQAESWPSSRVKNGSVALRSRLSGTTSIHCESWLAEDSSQSCFDCTSSLPQPAINVPPRSSFEAGSVPEHGPVAYTSSVMRGVGALKAFVHKKWDDRQVFQRISPGEAPCVDTILIKPTQSPINSTTAAASRTLLKPDDHIATFSAKFNTEYYLIPSMLRSFSELWQQACHNGSTCSGGFAPLHVLRHIRNPISPYLSGFAPGKNQPDPAHPPVEGPQHKTTPAPMEPLPNGSDAVQDNLLPDLKQSLPTPTQSPPKSATAAGQPHVTGFGRNPEHMRGSSMAIVIGLVAGVMWF